MKDQEKLKPGVYHGKRKVRKFPIFNHEYAVVVPKNPDRLDDATKRKLRVVGGQKSLVVGGYNRKGRLKMGVSDTTDVQAAKADPKRMRLISDKGSNKAAKTAVKAVKSFKPRAYPGVIKNVSGKGVNSNSVARSLVEEATGEKLEKGFRRAPGGNNRVEFCTPAQHILFSSQQIKSSKDNTYAKTLRVAAGLEDGYYKNSQGNKVNVTSDNLGLNHAQVVRSAYGTGKKIHRGVGRGSRLVKDVADVATGKERGRDQAGRKKKREWEKGYFKNAVGSAVATAGVLAYYRGLKKSRNMKARHIKATRYISKKVNGLVPGAVRLSSPAQEIIEFDAQAARAGWDVRDARGKSARVFAPGSRRRVRRDKEWHEKKANERKLWIAGIIGAGALGVLGGSKLAKRPRNIKVTKDLSKVGSDVIRPKFG